MGLLLSPVPHGTILKAGYTAFQGFAGGLFAVLFGAARAPGARCAHVLRTCALNVFYIMKFGAISGVTIPKTRGPTHPTAST